MLQYIHDGHQGKERCLLRARNTVFWPKITYDIQELIERCIICQEHGKSQSIIGITQELPPFPWHTLATDIFYWKRMDFLIVADVFSKYFLVGKLANSSSAAVCAEIATIVTELVLPHIIRSDNGPCYNSKEFQQLLQCYNITHHTSSPHHPRSNGFVERMVGVAKKLMDKAGSEGKPWISGLYEYRMTPQSGSIASPLQLITQCTPREKDLPQLPSTLGAQEMYETHQELIRRQPNKPERNYIELTPGMAVWVQHRQNTSWEPATVVSQSSSNSYWIMQENGTDQPKVYRRTRSMLKIRCTNVQQTRHNYSQSTETEKAKFQTHLLIMMKETLSSAILSRKYQMILFTQQNQILPLLLLLYFQKKGRKLQKMFLYLQTFLHLHPHWRQSRNSLTLQDQKSQQGRTLEGQPVHLVTFTCKRSGHYLNLDQWITSTKLNFQMYTRAEYTRAIAYIETCCKRHNFFQDH